MALLYTATMSVCLSVCPYARIDQNIYIVAYKYILIFNYIAVFNYVVVTKGQFAYAQ